VGIKVERERERERESDRVYIFSYLKAGEPGGKKTTWEI